MSHRSEQHLRGQPNSSNIGIPRLRPFDAVAFEQAVTGMLAATGIDVAGEHLKATSRTVREVWQRRLLDGYDVDPANALGAGFEDPSNDMVIMRSVTVHGMCPHHLLPFRGIAHVGYLPGGRLYGFGGITRLIDAICHRFVYQEWATNAIANALITHGGARGAACVIEAEQLCLLVAEVRRGDERVVTQCFAGEIEGDPAARAIFLRAIER
jgi:GTP cyclohydrolase I